MANEVTIRTSLHVLKASNNIDYQSRPTEFRGDLTGSKGPGPGVTTVSTAGTDIDFSEFTTPGYVRIQNQDATNFVELGIWDPQITKFYPLLEILPGQSYVLRWSRNITREFATGTGTTGPDTNTIRLKADTAAVPVLIETFES